MDTLKQSFKSDHANLLSVESIAYYWHMKKFIETEGKHKRQQN